MDTLLENQKDLKGKARISYFKLSKNADLSKQNDKNIKNFYDFCKKFLSLRDKYLESIGSMSSEFNSKESSLGFKQICAEITGEQYGKYLNDLINLEVPTFMDKTFNLFLNSIKYKRIFFNLYSTDPKNKNLDNIKNESSLAEQQFWLDIYRKNTELEGHLNSL